MKKNNVIASNKRVCIIGAGLAGCDAAWFLAENGLKVDLVEAKRLKLNPAQKIPDFAELVCTNSLKSQAPGSAHGLLKIEMETLGSLILDKARVHAVPAGDALAVDREKFSASITEAISNHDNIKVHDLDVDDPLALCQKLNCEHVIVATGPLTNPGLSTWFQQTISNDDFYFYDAIAPVVDADSLDYSKLYFKDRYKDNLEQADYLNVPLDKKQYLQLIEQLVDAEKVLPKDFEKENFFEACLPIDLMAERGVDTARFSCMKPVGLEMPDGSIPYAAIQLRKENLKGSAFNMVGFQTRLKYPEQIRVFRQIPGFEKAEFIHLGLVHRNSFLNAKKLLNFDLSSKQFPHLSFAGQITGVEGYTESAAIGLYVAYQVFRKCLGMESVKFDVHTPIGALIEYLMTIKKPVPSNINFGLLPTAQLNQEQRRDRQRRKLKKMLVYERGLKSIQDFSKSMS